MRTLPLKRVARVAVSNVDKKTIDDQERVRLCNYTDVYYNPTITDRLDFMEASASDEQISAFSLRAGDVLITKDSETADDIGVPARVPFDVAGVLCGYHLALIRPDVAQIDGSFLYWVLASTSTRRRFAVDATGVTRFGLRSDSILNVPVPLPTFRGQRAIADYLDAETARIDALITKKRRLAEMVALRTSGSVEVAIREATALAPPVPLKFVVDEVTVGIVVTPSAWYAGEGVPALRGVNVEAGHIDLTDLVHISEEGHLLHQKSALRAGDLVTVRTGQAGATAIVPAELDGANAIDLLITRPSSRMVPEYLEYVLNSEWTQSHVREHSVGTIQSHFNVGALRELPVPVPAVDVQLSIVARLRELSEHAAALTGRLARQIDLLAEHRQALITAAVTGETPIAALA